MVAEHYDDGEGELLNRIRKIAPDVPIAVALDFHTQMTDGHDPAAPRSSPATAPIRTSTWPTPRAAPAAR